MLMSKVVVIASKFLPEYSGPGERIDRLYTWLEASNSIPKPFIFCDSQDYISSKKYEFNGHSVFRSGLSSYRFFNRYLPVLVKILLELESLVVLMKPIRESGVVHILGSSPVTHAALFWSKLFKKRVVLELVNRNSKVYQKMFGIYTIRTSAKRTSYVVISDELESRCLDSGFKGNIWSRPNPVDVKRFVTSRVSNVFTRQSDQYRLLYVASFIPRKNQLRLVQIMSNLPDCYSLVLAGPLTNKLESEPYYNKVLDEIERLKLNAKITLVPEFVDTAELLNECDIYIMPAVNEGLGTPMLEALCAKRPIIANIQEPVFRDWVEQGVAGYTVPMTSQGLLEGLTKCKDLRKDDFDSYCALVRDKVNSEFIHNKYFDLLSK